MAHDNTISESQGVTVVQVAENACGALWEDLRSRLDAGVRVVILDFSAVAYLNSMNIAAVISLRNKLMEAQVGLLLAEVNESVRSVFRILKLERLFNLELNMAQALEAAHNR